MKIEISSVVYKDLPQKEYRRTVHTNHCFSTVASKGLQGLYNFPHLNWSGRDFHPADMSKPNIS